MNAPTRPAYSWSHSGVPNSSQAAGSRKAWPSLAPRRLTTTSGATSGRRCAAYAGQS